MGIPLDWVRKNILQNILQVFRIAMVLKSQKRCTTEDKILEEDMSAQETKTGVPAVATLFVTFIR